jgi:type IV pilus assembly protein PilC
MAVFEYVAEDTQGRQVSGIYEDVEDSRQLRRELGKLGYKLIRAGVSARNASLRRLRGRIAPADLTTFAYEFAEMNSAGLSVVRCLEMVELQTRNLRLKAILSQVRRNVETGSSLAEAFEPYRNVFGDFFLGMVEAGQSGGKLAKTMSMAAEYLEKQQEIRTKIRTAFAYPVVVGCMCIAILTAIMIFVIPVFQKLYKQLHVELPGPTRVLIVVSESMRDGFFILPIAAVLLYGLWRRMQTDPAFRARWERLLMRLPMFGKLIRLVLVSRYIRTLAMMIEAGIGMVEALEHARRICRHSEMDRIGQTLEQKVLTGSSLAGPMGGFDIFPPVIVQLAAAGEEAGILGEMLNKGAGCLEAGADRMIRSMLVKIEPILSVVMGLVVGMTLMGVYLPMFDYMSQIK